MQAISVRCPECNAVVDSHGGDQVTCTYCGTKARVQRRTQFLQRAIPLPPMRPTDPRAIAVAKPSNAPIFIIAGVSFGFLAVVGVVIAIAGKSSPPVAPGVPPAVAVASTSAPDAPKPPYWMAGAPLVRDVDGDGTEDLIGVRRYIGDVDALSLMALSGKDGHLLWETPHLGTYNEVYIDPFQLVGDVVVRADRVANLIGYAAKDGKQLWKQPFGEVVKTLCDGKVQTADDKWWTLDAKTGEHTAIALKKSETPRCGVVQITGNTSDKFTGVEKLDGYPDLPNMSANKVFTRDDGLPVVVVGYRHPGTAVSMLAAVGPPPKWKPVAWSVEIAATDALRAQQWGTDYIAFDDDAIATIYTTASASSDSNLTLFARKDGARRWVVPLEKYDYQGSPSFTGIGVTKDAVIVALWGELRSYARADGKLRWRVGKG